MRRTSRSKGKKSDVYSDAEEEVSGSVKADNDETGSGNDVEASNSTGKKRNARGRVKASEENHAEDKEDKDSEEQENGKPPSKRRKKDNDENLSLDGSKVESDEEVDKSVNNRKKRGKQEEEDKNEESEVKTDAIAENGKAQPKNKKKGKAAAKKKEDKKEEEEELDDEEYEVEKIVDQRTIKGRRQFLVRWVGYTEEHDTWEQEKELNCDTLIEEFLAEQEHNDEIEADAKKDKVEKKTKGKKQNKTPKKQNKRTSKGKNDEVNTNVEENDDEEDADESKEYEVEKIIEVHFRKDKTREFLIRWKGFSSKEDTWEPEEHLNCSELINKFMEKVEKAKSAEQRELRLNPSHTKRYTLTMHGDKRQSRRNADKQRVTYHECD